MDYSIGLGQFNLAGLSNIEFRPGFRGWLVKTTRINTVRERLLVSSQDRRYIRPLQALLVGLEVGLAGRGQRRVEGPPCRLDQIGLDSFVDPDVFIVQREGCESHRKDPLLWLCGELDCQFGHRVSVGIANASMTPT